MCVCIKCILPPVKRQDQPVQNKSPFPLFLSLFSFSSAIVGLLDFEVGVLVIETSQDFLITI